MASSRLADVWPSTGRDASVRTPLGSRSRREGTLHLSICPGIFSVAGRTTPVRGVHWEASKLSLSGNGFRALDRRDLEVFALAFRQRNSGWGKPIMLFVELN